MGLPSAQIKPRATQKGPQRLPEATRGLHRPPHGPERQGTTQIRAKYAETHAGRVNKIKSYRPGMCFMASYIDGRTRADDKTLKPTPGW